MSDSMKKATGESLATDPVAENTSISSRRIIPNKGVTCKASEPLKIMQSGLMKFKNNDLITSDIVAKELGVRHFDLLKSVKKAEKYTRLMNDNHRSLNYNPKFENYSYTDARGRAQKSVRMNLDGVKALIKVIDTQEAYNYYAMLISDHNNLQLERMNRADSKIFHSQLTDALQELYHRLHEAGSSQNEQNLYTNFNKKAYIALTGKKYEHNALDKLDGDDAGRLSVLRVDCLNMLEQWLNTISDPREIRAKLWAFIDGFNRQVRWSA